MSRTTCQDTMSTPFLIILLALLAIATAAIPVLVGSVKYGRSVDESGSNTIHLTTREANCWHARLGRRSRRILHEPAADTEPTIASGGPR